MALAFYDRPALARMLQNPYVLLPLLRSCGCPDGPGLSLAGWAPGLSRDFKQYLELAPEVRELIRHVYNSQYAAALKLLAVLKVSLASPPSAAPHQACIGSEPRFSDGTAAFRMTFSWTSTEAQPGRPCTRRSAATR
jgi:hypothetical protein